MTLQLTSLINVLIAPKYYYAEALDGAILKRVSIQINGASAEHSEKRGICNSSVCWFWNVPRYLRVTIAAEVTQ